MDVAALKDSPVGILVPVSGTDGRTGDTYDYEAFLPNPLSETVDLSTETWNQVVAASSALTRLDQAGRQVPNPALLRRPSIRREAQSTSALEGTHAAFTDLLDADIDEDQSPSAAVTEVLNYVRAAEQAFDWIVERPITKTLLCELQAMLVRGTDGDLPDAGGIRSRQVLIGPQGCSVGEARFVPPPAGDQLQAGLDQWITWVNEPGELPAVVRSALAHYQFEALHPFSDGNGRIGRLVIVLHLMRAGVLSEPLLVVSPWFEARRHEYQDQLLALSQTGDFNAWIQFFCQGLEAQANHTASKIQQLLSFQTDLREMVRQGAITGTAAKITEDLIGVPVVSPKWAARRYDVSYQAANTAIAKLVENGILVEITGRTYRRVFASRQVLRIVES